MQLTKTVLVFLTASSVALKVNTCSTEQSVLRIEKSIPLQFWGVESGKKIALIKRTSLGLVEGVSEPMYISPVPVG